MRSELDMITRMGELGEVMSVDLDGLGMECSMPWFSVSSDWVSVIRTGSTVSDKTFGCKMLLDSQATLHALKDEALMKYQGL